MSCQHWIQYLNMNTTLAIMFGLIYGVWGHFQQYFSYILAISFIGGGNRSTQRKPLTWRKQTKSSYTQKIHFITLPFCIPSLILSYNKYILTLLSCEWHIMAYHCPSVRPSVRHERSHANSTWDYYRNDDLRIDIKKNPQFSLLSFQICETSFIAKDFKIILVFQSFDWERACWWLFQKLDIYILWFFLHSS